MEMIKKKARCYLLEEINTVNYEIKDNRLADIYKTEDNVKLNIETTDDLEIVRMGNFIADMWFNNWELKSGEGIAKIGKSWIKIKENFNRTEIMEIIQECEIIWFKEKKPYYLNTEEDEEIEQWLRLKENREITVELKKYYPKISIIDKKTTEIVERYITKSLHKLLNSEYIERENRLFHKFIFNVMDKRHVLPFLRRVLTVKEHLIKLYKWMLKNEFAGAMLKLGLLSKHYSGLNLRRTISKVFEVAEKIKLNEGVKPMKLFLLNWLLNDRVFYSFFTNKYLQTFSNDWVLTYDGITVKEMRRIWRNEEDYNKRKNKDGSRKKMIRGWSSIGLGKQCEAFK